MTRKINVKLLILALYAINVTLSQESYTECPYGDNLLQPLYQCPGFRMRINPKPGKYCYLSFDYNLNAFWDCDHEQHGSGTLWSLAGNDKNQLKSLDGYYLQYDRAQTNQLIVNTDPQCVTKFIFQSDGKVYIDRKKERCYLYADTQYDVLIDCCSKNEQHGDIIEFVWDGIKLPVPGELYELPDGSGNFTLSENTIYMHQSHTLQCNIDVDDEENILDTSFVEITNEMYESKNIQNGSILLVNLNIWSVLPQDCTKYPALKVIESNLLQDSVQLFVKEASLFEYIMEIDIDIENGTFTDDGREAPIKVNLDIFEENNITNGTLTVDELKCAEFDDNDGSIINITTPIDDKCGGQTSIEQEGGIYGNGFNTDIPVRRRLFFGWIKDKVIDPVIDNVVKPVIKVIDTLIDILRGDVDERIFESGLYINKNYEYSISGKKTMTDSGVTITGSIKSKVIINFDCGVYVHLKAKYTLFSLNPSFDYFRFIIGAENEFSSSINVDVKGGIQIEYEVIRKEKIKIYFLGPVPILVKLYGVFSVGYKVELEMILSAYVGYNRIFIEFGVEYDNGWRQISNSNLNFNTYGIIGGHIEDSKTCINGVFAPYIQLKFGVMFYEFVDVYLSGTLSLENGFQWPATCDSVTPCDQTVTQLKATQDLHLAIAIGLDVSISKVGLSVYKKEWHIYENKWPLQDPRCSNLRIPALDGLCCGNRCTTGHISPQPLYECAFRIKIKNMECYLSIGPPGWVDLFNPGEYNVFWDCTGKGALWQLTGDNKDQVVSSIGYYLEWDNDKGIGFNIGINERNLKGDTLHGDSWSFGTDNRGYAVVDNERCYFKIAMERIQQLHQPHPNYQFNGEMYVTGYEARVDCDIGNLGFNDPSWYLMEYVSEAIRIDLFPVFPANNYHGIDIVDNNVYHIKNDFP